MADLIENRNGKDCMAYNLKGGTPWHSKGFACDGLMTPNQALVAAGMDWEVELRNVYLENDGALLEIPNQFAVTRVTDNRVYQIVSERYSPIQNAEVAKFIGDLFGQNKATVEACGSLKMGAVLWFLLKLEGIVNVKGDEILEYILVTFSHDGSIALEMFWTPIRVVCWNTLRLARSKKRATFYARHTTNVAEKISNEVKQAEAVEILGLANLFYKDFGHVANRMANTNLPGSKVQEFLNATFGLELATLPEEVSTRTKNQQLEVLKLSEVGLGNEPHRGTLWGYYNGVVEYADFYKGYKGTTEKSEVKNPTGQLEGAMFGSGAKLKENAWAYLSKIAC